MWFSRRSYWYSRKVRSRHFQLRNAGRVFNEASRRLQWNCTKSYRNGSRCQCGRSLWQVHLLYRELKTLYLSCYNEGDKLPLLTLPRTHKCKRTNMGSSGTTSYSESRFSNEDTTRSAFRNLTVVVQGIQGFWSPI